MKLKLKKISTKSFVLTFTVINVIAGVILGAIVSLVYLIAPPPDQNNGEMGVWAVLIFPILNGLLALSTGAFLSWIYNLLAQKFGGIELEFDKVE
jgi:membrane-anchored glycerophosphoryl diester phosphodiesterase (GDPDase)